MDIKQQKDKNKNIFYCVNLTKSEIKNKKYTAKVFQLKKSDNDQVNITKTRTVHFGDNRYQDFTQHKDKKRKQNYINRHKMREKWTMADNGIFTAGFWAKNLLWNKGTIEDSINDIKKRFNIDILNNINR